MMRKRLAFLPVFCFLLLSLTTALAETLSTNVESIEKYGNLMLSIPGSEFLNEGYDYGDLITVTLNGTDYDMPVCSNYSDVDQGNAVCRVVIKPELNEDYIVLAVNLGDMAALSGIASQEKTDEDPGYIWYYNVPGPVSVTFSMKEKGGYYDELVIRHLVRSEQREDYPDLSDEAFANFRVISTTGMALNTLYRSSSPVSPEINRNHEADTASGAVGIKTFINLADSEITMKAYEGFADTYYSGQNIICLNLGVDFTSDDFRKGLAEGLRFLASHEGPYLVHCAEGKDRAGFVSAVLEALMGATADEITKDYMITYANYYNVQEGTEQYQTLASRNIQKSLATAFGQESIFSCDLQKCAVQYLESIGLTADEISEVQARLTD